MTARASAVGLLAYSAFAFVGVAHVPHSAWAADIADVCKGSRVACGVAADETFAFAQEQLDTPGTGPAPRAAGDGPTTVRVFDYAPACSGNERNGDLLCPGAVTACPQSGDLSYWVWAKVLDRSTGDTVVDWQRLPGSTCLGPADAGLDVDEAIAGYLATEFRRLMVLKADVHVQPQGSTLVNYETGFFTTARDYVLPTFSLLGSSVVVTAHAASYDWHFGDGNVDRDAGPGARDTLEVMHTYRTNGRVAVAVEVEWTGTYRINGGPVRSVFGTARTTSVPVALQVKQARSELITR